MGRAPTNNKQKLIDTAMDLIWQSSYGSVSVDEICKKSDVQKGSFYYYFSSKIDLTLSALDYFSEKSKPAFEEVFDLNILPIERFKRFCDVGYGLQKKTFQKYGKVCGCPFMTLGSEIGGDEPEVRKRAEKIFQQQERYYEQCINDMIALGQLPKTINASTKAKQIYSYVIGCLMMARILNSLAPIEKNMKIGIFNILGIKEEHIEIA